MSRLEFNDSDLLRIGIKQSARALTDNVARTLYIAKDADPNLVQDLVRLAESRQVPVEYADTMKALGKACGIDVGAATAVVLK